MVFTPLDYLEIQKYLENPKIHKVSKSDAASQGSKCTAHGVRTDRFFSIQMFMVPEKFKESEKGGGLLCHMTE